MRNREPILEILKRLMRGIKRRTQYLKLRVEVECILILFASYYPNLIFQPSEIDSNNFESILELSSESENVLPPIIIDLMSEQQTWHNSTTKHKFQLIYGINFTHISPIESTIGFMKFASQNIANDGFALLYGPFKVNGEFTTPSNESFDTSLRHRNPLWGYRDIESDVGRIANDFGLVLTQTFEMPANNHILVFNCTQ